MGTGVSSKKTTSEKRSKKKKIRSNKHRDSSSPAYSSDSEDRSRARKKSSRRELKRKRDSKKPDKRKRRKTRSTSSDSSRACFTCGGRSSDSEYEKPMRSGRRAKLGTRERSRGGEKERGRRRSRKTSRERNSRLHRSQSCSSCGGCSSRSISHSRGYDEEKSLEKDRSRKLKSVLAGTNAAEETEDRYRSKDENRPEIIQAYDDFPSSQSNDSYDAGKKRERDPVLYALEKKRQVEVIGVIGEEGGAYVKKEEVLSSTPVIRPAENAGESLVHEFGSTKEPCTRKKSEADANTCTSEVADLELLLRQKALENFKKFRGGLSASTRSLGDPKDEPTQTESFKPDGIKVGIKQLHQSAKKFVVSPEQKPAASRDLPIECKAKSVAYPLSQVANEGRSKEKRVVNLVGSSPNDSLSSKTIANSINSGFASRCENVNKTQNQIKNVHDPAKKISLEQTSLAKDIQDTKASAEPGSSNLHVADVNIADEPAPGASSCPNFESGNCKSNEPMVDARSGSQYEQKTMSVMRGGEMVQVSYKVYIPKKAPALARRKLQR